MKKQAKKSWLKAGLCLCLSAMMMSTAVFPAMATAGEDPGKVDDKDKTFPDPDSFSYDDVEVNFAKALQYSLYFYDANKCGKRTGNLEWRGDCHMEDEKIPLKHWDNESKTAPIGVNLTDEFIAEHIDILDPDGDGCLNCEGGMHDAGDHVKFGLPGSYAASTVGWGYYEFRDAYEKSGNAAHVEQILHAFCDFYLNGIYYNEDGSVLAFVYQVGEGNCDHNYWICPELQNTGLKDFGRPAYLATVDTPASDMCAGTAAALAISYLNFKDTEPEYAEECLKGAYALYDFAVATHAEQIGADGKPNVMKVTSLGYDGGFYTSNYDYDELAWAAVWLYECTIDKDPTKQQEAYDEYIDAIIHVDESISGDMGAHPYTGYMRRIIADTGNCWQNIWVHCWDTVWGGVFAKLAPITNISRDWYIFRWNLEYWSGMRPGTESTLVEPYCPIGCTTHKKFGLDDEIWNTKITAEEIKDLPECDGAWLAKTPHGFAMLNDYGSARYDTAAQLCACVYAKETGDTTFVDWAAGQMEYIMGKNPMNRPYIVGYSDTAASHPHHRAAHGSQDLNMDHPADQTHVLWGALVGGPDAVDWHRDLTKDYIYNEVAVDYNAAFTGACAGLYHFLGTEDMKNQPDFPPAESTMKTPEEMEEFTLKAVVGQEDEQSTQILIELTNQTQRPPRYLENIKVRYYFNISELIANGYTVDDVQVRPDYDMMASNCDNKYQVSYEVEQYNDKGDCYIELTWPAYQFYGKLQYQFALMCTKQNADYKFFWDPTNDYSRKDLTTAEALGVSLNIAAQPVTKLTMYVEGEQVWGEDPDGKTADKVNTDPKEGPTKQKYGDLNDDDLVNIKDAVLMARLVGGDATLKISADGKSNADVNVDGKYDADDLMMLLQAICGQIPYARLGQPQK